MNSHPIVLKNGHPNAVGSFGSTAALLGTTGTHAKDQCDIAEIRLDLLAAEGTAIEPQLWAHLSGVPLLFTARRIEEGGALHLDAAHRTDLLRGALDDAAIIDVEVASMAEMRDLLDEAESRGIPWIASFHDFSELPADELLYDAAARAKSAGAAVFKVAAKIQHTADLARLVAFQHADHGLPVASMGMGALAPASRILCAQSGSTLNYGYFGEKPTAPGQWEVAWLKRIIAGLEPLFP